MIPIGQSESVYQKLTIVLLFCFFQLWIVRTGFHDEHRTNLTDVYNFLHVVMYKTSRIWKACTRIILFTLSFLFFL